MLVLVCIAQTHIIVKTKCNNIGIVSSIAQRGKAYLSRIYKTLTANASHYIHTR